MALRYRRQTVHIGQHAVRLRTLWNRQQFHDPRGEAAALGISAASWPIFGVLWPAGEALAQMMLTQPLEGRRILEVGCGIALPSLLLKLRGATVSATDQHPLAGDFLRHNAALNGTGEIDFWRCDWRDPCTTRGRFDLIIGSDLLYEREQAALLADFIDRHAHAGCDVLIVDPARGNAGRFSKLMLAKGFSSSQLPGEAAFGRRLQFTRG